MQIKKTNKNHYAHKIGFRPQILTLLTVSPLVWIFRCKFVVIFLKDPLAHILPSKALEKFDDLAC